MLERLLFAFITVLISGVVLGQTAPFYCTGVSSIQWLGSLNLTVIADKLEGESIRMDYKSPQGDQTSEIFFQENGVAMQYINELDGSFDDLYIRNWGILKKKNAICVTLADSPIVTGNESVDWWMLLDFEGLKVEHAWNSGVDKTTHSIMSDISFLYPTCAECLKLFRGRGDQ